jgi:hypothetical protein
LHESNTERRPSFVVRNGFACEDEDCWECYIEGIPGKKLRVLANHARQHLFSAEHLDFDEPEEHDDTIDNVQLDETDDDSIDDGWMIHLGSDRQGLESPVEPGDLTQANIQELRLAMEILWKCAKYVAVYPDGTSYPSAKYLMQAMPPWLHGYFLPVLKQFQVRWIAKLLLNFTIALLPEWLAIVPPVEQNVISEFNLEDLPWYHNNAAANHGRPTGVQQGSPGGPAGGAPRVDPVNGPSMHPTTAPTDTHCSTASARSTATSAETPLSRTIHHDKCLTMFVLVVTRKCFLRFLVRLLLPSALDL